MHRFILFMLLLATGPTAASAAEDFPYGSSLSFAAVRNGQTIGHHILTFWTACEEWSGLDVSS